MKCNYLIETVCDKNITKLIEVLITKTKYTSFKNFILLCK